MAGLSIPSQPHKAAPGPAGDMFHFRTKVVPFTFIHMSKALQIGVTRPQPPDRKWNETEQNGTLFLRKALQAHPPPGKTKVRDLTLHLEGIRPNPTWPYPIVEVVESKVEGPFRGFNLLGEVAP